MPNEHDMAEIKSPFDIYKHLEKSNCGLCLQASCMAFAAAVFKGIKRLEECPRLDKEFLAALSGSLPATRDLAAEQARHFEPLREKIRHRDLAQDANCLGGSFEAGRLTIKCLGKDFVVDSQGELTSECHINTWVQAPLLNYVADNPGRDLTGQWTTFGKLQQGRSWDQFFAKRCEQPLKKIIDADPDLFFDLVTMFDCREISGFESADHAILLYPLPKLPMLICYWQAEDDLDSKLNIFFDTSADANINIESIYLLGTGMVEMFTKIIKTHTQG